LKGYLVFVSIKQSILRKQLDIDFSHLPNGGVFYKNSPKQTEKLSYKNNRSYFLCKLQDVLEVKKYDFVKKRELMFFTFLF
jgi:hypothetical protein